MREWTESWPKLDGEGQLLLLQRAISERPDDARLRAIRGKALSEAKRYAEALESFQAAIALGPDLRPAWSGMARCLYKLRRPEAVLALVEAGWGGNEMDAAYHRGRALIAMREVAAGQDSLRRVVHTTDVRDDALRALLDSFARCGSGDEIIALQDRLDDRRRRTSLARAYRAVALSMLGRTDEANAIVDLDRCVRRYRFDPPSALGSLAEFNGRLSQLIMAATSPSLAGADKVLNYNAPLRSSAELRALRDFIRTSVADYAEQSDAVRAASGMPDPPRSAEFSLGTVILRRQGRNGQHIHPISYLSTVYHVEVPAQTDAANERRGALVLGPCGSVAGGHRACWGERLVEPRAGWLTIFPSHVFHDVIPTKSDEPRITVVSDLNPCGQ